MTEYSSHGRHISCRDFPFSFLVLLTVHYSSLPFVRNSVKCLLAFKHPTANGPHIMMFEWPGDLMYILYTNLMFCNARLPCVT